MRYRIKPEEAPIEMVLEPYEVECREYCQHDKLDIEKVAGRHSYKYRILNGKRQVFLEWRLPRTKTFRIRGMFWCGWYGKPGLIPGGFPQHQRALRRAI